MWGWLMTNGIWIIIVFGLIVLLMLFFSEKAQKLIGKLEPEKWQSKAFGSINAVFWIIEGIAVIIVILAFIALTLSEEGAGSLLTSQSIQRWFTEHGISNIIILVVGIVLWFVMKQTVPPLVRRIMARPQKGESREGLRRRADTLQGVFLG